MDQRQGNNIKTLSESLELLKITEEDTSEKMTEYMNKMLVAPTSTTVQNEQVEMPRNIVLDPE